ncbi:MAG: CpsB/CapC family capsule biosynthesis tyrosine phosphatase [Myxococcota bacterium]
MSWASIRAMLCRAVGYIDLHCHWVAGIDDGARTPTESRDMLAALADVGFSRVTATPHMRAGMFPNSRADIESAYARTVDALGSGAEDLPVGGLASEHHLDDLALVALLGGEGLPYPPAARAALIEFPNERFPVAYRKGIARLKKNRIRTVLAHPERYRPVWEDITVLDSMLDGGALLLLDVAALVGKYGRAARRSAEELLGAGYYYAACSDAHRPRDAEPVAKGIAVLEKLMGTEEADFLLREGPLRILEGTVDD